MTESPSQLSWSAKWSRRGIGALLVLVVVVFLICLIALIVS